MSLQLKTKIRSGYIIAFILLLVSYFLIFYTIQRLVKGTKAVTRSYDIINTLESMQSLISDAETSARGYVINKEERFLEPYVQAAQRLLATRNELRELTGNEYRYRSKIDTLNRLTERKMKLMSDGLGKFKAAGLTITPEMQLNRDESFSMMDSIRLLIVQLKAGEERIMDSRSAALSGAFTSTDIIAVTSLVIALLTIIYSLVTYNRENKAREKADAMASVYHVNLEKNLMQLHKMNEELQALKQIEKFAATGRIARTIAHEVRNPLTNISLATEQLSENATDGSEQAQLFEMILRNSERINQLVTDLLQSTRFAQLNFEKVEINQLVDETLDMARDRIDLNNIGVKKVYMAGSHEVWVDKEKMKLAFLNIIVNAVEAMEKDKGKLTIITSIEKGKCVVEIKDNGSGMDSESLQKIFDPYFTNKKSGTGLGLTNTQNIILNHKGNIMVTSIPNQGTSFYITLQQGDGHIG